MAKGLEVYIKKKGQAINDDPVHKKDPTKYI